MTIPAKRAESGRFVAGQSGNPAGRPPGSKNRVNQLKLELEQSLRDDPLVQEKVRTIFNQMLDLAAAGNEKMIRLVMEKFISGASLDDVKHDGTHEYIFRIERAEPRQIEANVVDAECVEVKEQ